MAVKILEVKRECCPATRFIGKDMSINQAHAIELRSIVIPRSKELGQFLFVEINTLEFGEGEYGFQN